jgi:hypothetical protein
MSMENRQFRPLSMNGFTQFAQPLSVQPVMYGPPPYGIWPVSFAPDTEAKTRELGQASTPPAGKQADLFGVLLGLSAAGAGIFMGLQPGPQTVKRYLAPGAAALAGIALLVKSV